MKKAVLINEKLGDVTDIDLDISPHKIEIFKILGGPQTLIGQWPDIDVVILKAEIGQGVTENSLPIPFDKEEVGGKILLVRMDENSDPQDFTLTEYLGYKGVSV
jgi:sporulation protein YlmC with PRC-barrel domain